MNDIATLDKHLPENLRLPPQSLEAEQAVLGGLMLSGDSWDQVSERVGESDFYRKEHQQIFRVMLQLAENDQPRDLVTVSEALQKLGQLESAGGISYLSELSRNTPSAANIAAYAEIVRERSVLRQLISVSNKVAGRAFNPEGAHSTEILDEAESSIFKIAEQMKKGAGPQAIKNVLVKTVERIEELYKSKKTVTGLSSGFDEFDKMTSGLQKSDMIVVAARPSMGKTTFAMNLCESVVIKNNKP
ncbi:MAG: replicative DNA helicase, partial [Alcanivoracaceae bacterium]|nr:replicative DNA helicase [Alcanivoracaceae bacterium]